MVNGPLFRNVLVYTVPVILTGILQLLFNAADLVVVGRYCGSVCVAAVGSTGAIINLVINLFIGLSVGVGVTVATALGAGDGRKVHEAIHTAMPVGLIGGVFLAALGVMISRRLLIWMDTPADVLDLATTYMEIYFCGMPASLVYNYGAAVMRADGDTRRPLTYLTVSGILNVALNLLFVTVLGRNVDGVAYATVASQYLSAVLVVAALIIRRDVCRFEPGKMKIRRSSLLQIVRIGLPAGIQGSLFSISNVMIQSSINSFGSVAMSGNSAASNIAGFIYTSQNAFSQTALNFTGQNAGAGRLDNIPKIRKYCTAYVIGVGLFLGIVVNIFAKPLLSIYLTDSPEAIGYGEVKLLYLCLPYFLCGMQEIMTGMIRGLGSSMLPMIVCIGGICGYRIIWIATVFKIERFHTLEMLYITYPISWIITYIALLICYRIVYRRRLENNDY